LGEIKVAAITHKLASLFTVMNSLNKDASAHKPKHCMTDWKMSLVDVFKILQKYVW